MASRGKCEFTSQSRPRNNNKSATEENTNRISSTIGSKNIHGQTEIINLSESEGEQEIKQSNGLHGQPPNINNPNNNIKSIKTKSNSLFDKVGGYKQINEKPTTYPRERLHKKFKLSEKLKERRFTIRLVFRLNTDKFKEYIKSNCKNTPISREIVTELLEVEQIVDNGESIIWDRIPGNEFDAKHGIRLS